MNYRGGGCVFARLAIRGYCLACCLLSPVAFRPLADWQDCGILSFAYIIGPAAAKESRHLRAATATLIDFAGFLCSGCSARYDSDVLDRLACRDHSYTSYRWIGVHIRYHGTEEGEGLLDARHV